LKLKKILAVLLVFAMMFSLVAITASAVDFEGDGTAENPLQIGTAEELQAFAARVTAAENGDEALCAILTADLTIENWTVIGKWPTGTAIAQWSTDSPNPFSGTFDGDGHKLTLSKTGTAATTQIPATDYNMALFHTIGTNGIVKNLILDVYFSGNSYLAGVAIRNYGTIDYIMVDGSIIASAATSYLGGIVSINGCKEVDGVVVSGKILHCVNNADITCTYSNANTGAGSGSKIGGICGNFLGEMRYCVNLGTIIGADSFAALASTDTPSVAKPSPEWYIISDCYNAGAVINMSTRTETKFGAAMVNSTYGGLLGGALVRLLGWVDVGAYKVSNTFNYGTVLNGHGTEETASDDFSYQIVIGGVAGAEYLDYHIADVFSNIYYRDGIGGRLFAPSHLLDANGSSTDRVKTVIHSRTAEEFASVALAAALNNGRTGADAPWEYVAGNDYPTLKFERTGAANAYALAVSAGANGSVSSVSGNYNAGDEITVTATANGGYHFVNWTAEGIELETETASTQTFIMPANAVTLTANFAEDIPIPPTIDAVATYGGAITANGDGIYTVTPTVTGYVIDSIWIDGVQLNGVQSLTTYTTTGAQSPVRSVVASFAYTVNFNIPANGALSVSRGSETLTSGSIVRGGDALTIVATANSGYQLDALTINGLTRVGSTNDYTVTAAQSSRPSITATFKAASTPSTPYYPPSGSGSTAATPPSSEPSASQTTAPTPEPETKAPATSAPTVVDTETVAPDTTTTTNADSGKTTAVSEVKPEDVKTAVEDAKKAVEAEKAKPENEGKTVVAEVKIEATTAEMATVSEIDLVVETVRAIADAKDVVLTIETNNATITLDSAALDTIAQGKTDGETVKIVVEQVDNNSSTELNEKQKEKVGDGPALDLSVTVGTTVVHEFNGNVTVTVPYTPPATLNSADQDLLTVYYLDDDDNIQEMLGAKYDAATGTITFTTDHFSKFFVSEWISPFADISKPDWFYKDVRFAYSNGLISGTDKGFEPALNLTRAMLITILARHDGVDTTSGETWYSAAVKWGVQSGITDGSNLDGNITREQFATMLYRYSGLGDGWGGDALDWAQTQSIMNDGRGGDGATRAEVAAMLQRWLTQ